MKQFITITAFIGLSFSGYAQSNLHSATLKGKLIHFGAVATLEDFSDIQYMVPKSFNKVIVPEVDSTFSITIPLKAPGYFRLGRNKLYLSPGDNMEVLVDQAEASKSVFKGRGSIANNYLRNVPFPKGGSFLEAGKHLKPTPDETMDFLLLTARQKDASLAELRNISPIFRKLEKGRNRADLVKSIQAVKTYASYKMSKESKEKIAEYTTRFDNISKPVKDSLLKNFVDPNYLQIEVYRDIIEELDISKTSPANKQAFADWNNAFELAYQKIKPESNKAIVPEFKRDIAIIKSKKYRDILNLLILDKLKFGNGDTAIDFIVKDIDGSETKLSSLKGKLIYIDIWATWCGPCLAEMPHLEELKKKYIDQKDLAIVSLSVDDNDPIWLDNLNKRKPKGIQWRIDRAKLTEYGVETIPRYILIDKNFKVVEMDAPRASDAKLTALFEKLLK